MQRHCAPSGTRQRPPEERQKAGTFSKDGTEGHSLFIRGKEGKHQNFEWGRAVHKPLR